MIRIKKEVLSAKVYGTLKEMITNYRFLPGVRVNVEQLTRELGVSRTPIWEAVRRLEQEGLLENIPNRGVFMAEMTLDTAYDLYEIRRALERLAGRLAAANIEDRALRKMARCLENQLESVERGDLVGFSEKDFEFHSLIHKGARNPSLEEMLDSIRTKMQPVDMQIKTILPKLYQGHVEIWKALRSRDPVKAEASLGRHNGLILSLIAEEMRMATERREETKQLKIRYARWTSSPLRKGS